MPDKKTMKFTGSVKDGGVMVSPTGDRVALRWGDVVNLMIGNAVVSGLKVKDDMKGRWYVELPVDLASAVSLDVDPGRVAQSREWVLCEGASGKADKPKTGVDGWKL